MRWSTGEATVERLLQQGHIERVRGAQADGASWVDRARRGLEAARIVVEPAPDSCIILAYDAARQACVGLVAQQGLRPTTSGGHYAIEERSAPSSAPACGHLAGCGAGATSWSIRSTQPRRPRPTRLPKRSRPQTRSSAPSPSCCPTSVSSERRFHLSQKVCAGHHDSRVADLRVRSGLLSNVAAPLGQRIDEPFLSEQRNRLTHRLPGHVMLLLEVRLARDRVMRSEPTGPDLVTQNRR